MRGMGLEGGFAFWDDAGIHSERGRLAPEVTDAALAWLDRRDDRPFFLFLNYFDPHGPYTPPREFFTAFLPEPAEETPGGAQTSPVDATLSRNAARTIGTVVHRVLEEVDLAGDLRAQVGARAPAVTRLRGL